MKQDSRPGDSRVAAREGTVSPLSSSRSLTAEGYDAALRLIVERAQMLTLASGAAIALREGDLMVCRASAGTTAPTLGAQFDTQSGLSGECVRSARTLVCDDTESDPRVNLDVCRYLGIRSIAVLPICVERDVVGVFEAFSAHPGGFSGNEVATLESVRELITSIMRPGSQPESPAASELGARAAEIEPPAAPFQPIENRAASPIRPVKDNPPVAPFRGTIVPDPDDDLICEIEQRAESKPQSDLITSASQRIQAESQQLGATGGSALPAGADLDDDLICEIEMRSAGRPTPLEPEPHSADTLTSFVPAAARPPEHIVSRKLILAGVIVMLAGLVWLRWCNPAQRATRSAADSTPKAASTAPVSLIGAAPRNVECPRVGAVRPSALSRQLPRLGTTAGELFARERRARVSDSPSGLVFDPTEAL